MDEISEALGQGNVPLLAFVGLFLLTLSALCGHGMFYSLGRIRKEAINGDWYFLFFGSVLSFTFSSYWGWYFITNGSM